MGGQKSISGFWLSDWVKSQGVWSMLKLFREIKRMLVAGVLTTTVEAGFSLSDIGQAVRAADKPGKTGKILLRMGK